MFSAASKTGSQPSAAANYIEDVFSTYLYTGNGSTQTINNGIDLSTKGGMTWIKSRSNAQSHAVQDTIRGAGNAVATNQSGNQGYYVDSLTSFNSNGFSLGADTNTAGIYNANGYTYCSWSFRKQPKFFDVVTYTGNSTNRTIAHNLGSVPGMIIVKRTDDAGDWQVYHISNGNTQYMRLNTTQAVATGATRWNNTTPTSSVFSLGTDDTVNANAGTYVAYLFAHDAGGFGTTGTDNVISCGSFTTDANGNATVNLGYEPQYLMYKSSSAAGSWTVLDTMRGFCATNQSSNRLAVQSASAESAGLGGSPSATGFYGDDANYFAASNTTYIYMAIRRPMKVPTVGTTVFNTIARTGTGSTVSVTGAGFPPDMALIQRRNGGGDSGLYDRLRGPNILLYPQYDLREYAVTSYLNSFDQDGITLGTNTPNISGQTFANWLFKRASGFFDEVCYTGDGTYGNKNHNLTVAPELIISKARNGTGDWYTWLPSLNTSSNPDTGYLNSTAAFFNYFSGGTIATSTTFVPAEDTASTTYVAYLFATCPGVSKVGSYTGNGTTQSISCGFTGGARFVLIKRTNAAGDWYVYDTVRGMTTLTDPYLLINSGVAETATLGSVTSTAGGFTLNSTILAAINVSGGNYIFLAIA
jgi:hypothetical protein